MQHFCPVNQFSTGCFTLPERKEALPISSDVEAWLLTPKIANSEVNTEALQFCTLNTSNETRDEIVQSF